MDKQLLAILTRIADSTARIADALENNSQTQPRTQNVSPNFKRSLNKYQNFDWSEINAKIVMTDKNGPTVVTWNGVEYARRRHPDYDKGIWFSSYAGMRDGKKLYHRLISFTVSEGARPLPSEITDELTATPQAKPQATPRPPSPLDTLSYSEPVPVDETLHPAEARRLYYKLMPVLIQQDKNNVDVANRLSAAAAKQGYAHALAELQTLIVA